jgi:hypothetical protein
MRPAPEPDAAGAGHGRGEPERPAAIASARGHRERRHRVLAQHRRGDASPRRSKRDGIGQRVVAPVRFTVPCRPRLPAIRPIRPAEGMEVDGEVDVSGAERNRAAGAGGEARVGADRRVEAQPAAGAPWR